MKSRIICHAFLIIAGLTCSYAMAAEVLPSNEWRQGWDRKVIDSYSQGCTDSFIDDTNQARTQGGMGTLAAAELTPFKTAVQSMCTCITERLATSGSYADVKANYNQRMVELLREANAGGQCSRPVSDAFTMVRALVKR